MAPDKKALALAGGGPVGGIYELGALLALDEALEGVPLVDFDIFVGVSAGAFLASGLANGMTPVAMYDIFMKSHGVDDPFDPRILLRPAMREFMSRILSTPGLLFSATADYLLGKSWRLDSFIGAFRQLSRALPTGIFDHGEATAYLERLFSAEGRANDFRRLKRSLFLVATDLDTGEVTAFGAPGTRSVPISLAVQASAALPGLFPPVEIDGRNYVDGVLRKTLHASVALKEGAGLLICINPLVPFLEKREKLDGRIRGGSILEHGLPMVLSQTFRAIIHSRMQVGMERYRTEFPDADVVLFEPGRDDPKMFFTNVFSYAERWEMSQHAYHQTREQLRRRYDELAPVFARHGIGINRDILDEARTLPMSRGPGVRPSLDGAGAQLHQVLDELQTSLEKRAAS